MKVMRSYKTEVSPNKAQCTLLRKHAGAARFAWNWALDRRIKEYAETGRSSRAIDQHRQLNAIKATDFPWMYEVSKCAPQESLRDLDKAYKSFFDGKAKFPNFKNKKKGLGSFRLTGCIRVEQGRIKLPRIGWLRLKEKDYLPIDAKMNSVTVKERSGRWFVSVQVQEEIQDKTNNGAAIGIDLGLKVFLATSDGEFVDSPRYLAKSIRRLRRTSKSHSRKMEGSNNRKKSAKRLANIHYKISCQRSDFLHKTSSTLTKTNSVIVVESLNISGMVKNRSLSRSISDAGWSEFVRMLEYKSSWSGGQVLRADRFFPSTKTCSGCGHVKSEIKLSERVYLCDMCGLEVDRDTNAARNLLNLYTGSSSGIKACGDLPLGESSKQEPNIIEHG